MDSLDTWLNTQRGWRHFAVIWLMSLPGGVALGAIWAAWSNMFGPTILSAPSVLARLELGVVASVPLAVLIFATVPLSRQRLAKRGKNVRPRFLWRGVAAIYLLIGGNASLIWIEAQPAEWRRQHVLLVSCAWIVVEAAAIALTIWSYQSRRRGQRRTAEAPARDLGSLLGR